MRVAFVQGEAMGWDRASLLGDHPPSWNRDFSSWNCVPESLQFYRIFFVEKMSKGAIFGHFLKPPQKFTGPFAPGFFPGGSPSRGGGSGTSPD